MTLIKGIGGVFIESDNAQELSAWYTKVLGVELEAHPNGKDFYTVFWTRDVDSSELRENPVFAIRQAESPLAKTGRGFSLGLRVDDLEGVLEVLAGRGVEIGPKRLNWERGKHAWILDPDGNQIDLYEEVRPGQDVKQGEQ